MNIRIYQEILKRGICTYCRGAGERLTLLNCSNNWLTASGSVHTALLSSSLTLSQCSQLTNSRTKVQDHRNTDTEDKLSSHWNIIWNMETHRAVNLRWMALSRGMSVGLLGGEELVLWRLLLLSMEGDAWTVILCWKSAKCTCGSHSSQS